VTAARDVLCELRAIGARIEPVGDRLFLRAGLQPVPAKIIRRVREAKAKLLPLLYREAAPDAIARVAPLTYGEPGLEQPCAARRDRVVMLENGAFLHFCCECGRFGAFGYRVRLRAGQLGRWYCGEHRPNAPGKDVDANPELHKVR